MEGTSLKKDLVKSYIWFLIFNENKKGFDPKAQEKAIEQTKLVEKELSKSEKEKAIDQAEKLLGHKLINLWKLYSTVYSIPIN